MPKALINGSTDVSLYFVMRDATTHAPKTDVTVTDIDIYYQEQGAAQSAKADLTALAAADSAHADNKGFHCGNGLYRIDWPDAAFDGGAGKTVILVVVCTGCDTIYREIQLSPPVGAAASVTAGVTLADDAITAAKFDESTAFPLKSADTGATAVARTGADADTLETLSDQMDGAATAAELAKVPKSDSNVSWNATALAAINAQCDTAFADYDPPTKAEMDSAFSTTNGKIDTVDNIVDAIVLDTAFIEKWIIDKLVTTDNENGTLTTILYDDDGSTPLKTWVFTTATGTRAAAS